MKIEHDPSHRRLFAATRQHYQTRRELPLPVDAHGIARVLEARAERIIPARGIAGRKRHAVAFASRGRGRRRRRVRTLNLRSRRPHGRPGSTQDAAARNVWTSSGEQRVRRRE